jgi:hypothetical protein
LLCVSGKKSRLGLVELSVGQPDFLAARLNLMEHCSKSAGIWRKPSERCRPAHRTA